MKEKLNYIIKINGMILLLKIYKKILMQKVIPIRQLPYLLMNYLRMD